MKKIIFVVFNIFVGLAFAQDYSKNKSFVDSKNNSAKQATVKIWDKEPESFLGIVLGESISIIDCPTKIIGQYSNKSVLDTEAMKSLPNVCINKADPLYKYKISEKFITLENTPDLGIKYTVMVYLDENIAKKITISLDQRNFSVIYDVFQNKYGLPTSSLERAVRSNMGATFNSKNFTWVGKKISIYMYERLDTIDKSYVSIENNLIEQTDAESRHKKLNNESQKF